MFDEASRVKLAAISDADPQMLTGASTPSSERVKKAFLNDQTGRFVAAAQNFDIPADAEIDPTIERNPQSDQDEPVALSTSIDCKQWRDAIACCRLQG